MVRPSRQLFLISAVALSLTSCTAPLSNSTGSGGRNGATGGIGSADGGSDSSTGGSGSTTQETGTGTGGGTCLDFSPFGDPDCDGCAHAQCCQQIDDCLADPNCLNAESGLDLSTAAGAALDHCLLTCFETEPCGDKSTICDTNLTFSDPEIDGCFDPACCTEASACVGAGELVCIDCVNAYLGAQGVEKPGATCAALIGCGESEGCFP